MRYTFDKGFSLIELLVVIAVMGVIASIALVAINPQAQLAKLRNNERKNDLRAFQKALERYAVFNSGSYPSTGGGWCRTDPGTSPYDCGTTPFSRLLGTYIKELPVNPTSTFQPKCSSATYRTYLYRSNGTDYKFLAFCAVEGPYVANDPMNDGPRATYSYSVYSPGASGW